MSAFHNPTVLYLTAILAWVFAANQLFLFDKNKLEIRFFAIAQIILGFSWLGLANFIHSASLWLIPFLGLLGSELLLLMGVRCALNNPVKKQTQIFVGLGLLGMSALFLVGLNVEAPLGNLEVILLGPLLACYVYTAWYLHQSARDKSPYLQMIRWSVALKAILLAILILGALAALGDSYIQIDSPMVSLTLIVYLATLVWSNVAWILEQSVSPGKKVKINRVTSIDTGSKSKSDVLADSVKRFDLNDSPAHTALSDSPALVDLVNLTDQDKQDLLQKLTKRERDVFDWLIKDKKNGEIAVLLNCSETSVKVHRSKMVAKLGIRNVDDLKKLIS